MLYGKLVDLYLELEKTTKRLEKTYILAKFFLSCPKEDLEYVVYLVQGKVFAQWDERKLGMSSRLLLKAVSSSAGVSSNKVEDMWKREGDLGSVAEKLWAKKKQQTLFRTTLSLKKVVNNIRKLSTLEGQGTVNKKVGLVSELLGSASAQEARFIVRTVTETLRTGVGESAIRDALVWAFFEPSVKKLSLEEAVELKTKEEKESTNKAAEEVQHAFNMCTDYGKIALELKENGPEGLKKTKLTVGKAIKVMLYPKAKDIVEGLETVGKPAMIEPKLDGFRVQIHRSKDDVKLYTRRLENVTKQFPDVVKVVKKNVRSKDVILDTEIVGVDPKTKRAVPFQAISQRIRRKYDIEQLVKKLPVVVTVFDVIQLNGENMLDKPFEERRKKLKAVVKDEKNKVEVIEQLVTSDVKKIEKFYKKCLEKGHEGIMMKKMSGVYKPGKRVGSGVKIKPVMESLDLVIIAAEWGEGKRAKWLSSFTVACRSKNQFLTVGKVGTGIKEKSEEGVSFEELTKALKPLIISEKGRTVKVRPKVILEIVYEEIQKSPSYSSGYALRFPRVQRLRVDKPLSEINTIEDLKVYYKHQKK